MKNYIATFGICLVVAVPVANAQDATTLETDEQKFSYAVGVKIGENLAQEFSSQPGIDLTLLLQGLQASAGGGELLLSSEESNSVIQAQQKLAQEEVARMAEEKQAAGRAFLEEHKGREGVVVTDSGLQYSVMESGDAAGETATVNDTVVVHYQGTLVDGTVFDSSYARGEPATFSLQSIIPGWIEVLQLMRAGDKFSIVLPPELAYGERGAGQLIGPNEVLMFDIELIEIRQPAN